MRADRLVALMLLLQTRGKLTAKTLAGELGVSARTILRDVEALSIAGIPIYSEGGHGGGIALDEAYRTTLTGLRPAEIRTLFIANNHSLLRDVGLDEAGNHLQLKLLAALPAPQRPIVEHIRQRLMIDSTWWWQDAQPPAFWDDLQQAVYEDRCIAVTYEHYDGEIVERVLAPYSLVNKSSWWYLVAQRETEFRTYRVTRFHQVRLLAQTFPRDPDFDLQTYWQTHLQEFVEQFSGYRLTLKVEPQRSAFVKWLTAGRWQILQAADEQGWITLEVAFDTPILAKMLVFGLGQACVVLDPPELAAEVQQDAAALVVYLGKVD